MDTRKSEEIFSYLEKIHSRFGENSNLLVSSEITGNPKKFKDLSKELFLLRPLEEKYLEARKLEKRLADAQELLDTSNDPELVKMADEEVKDLLLQKKNLIKEVQALMVSDAVEDNRNVFLEIRAGAGGDEASLFASDLLRLYLRLAERRGWKADVVSTTYSSIGGIKEIIVYIKGPNVNKLLKFESGVHRVQRVPVTEASGRIHTSTVTVAVLLEVEDVEIGIQLKDIRIDTFAASGPGGQHVNKTQSAIRITHYPTGIVVTCQDEKSQHKNKDKALKVLKARLYEFEKNRQQKGIAQNRKSQVGTGERSEKIRTYNFPQNRVTDHRISGKNFNLAFTLDGDLADLIALLTENHHQQMIAEKMKNLIA